MKYLLKYKLFETKSKKAQKGDTPLELPHIFNQLPETVDHRLVKFICQNFGEEYYKSPWSHSYYSAKVGWQFKPDKSYRLANHWNFRTKTGNRDILHCETTSDVGEDNENWTIGQYDGELKKYNVILSFPFIQSESNNKKKRNLKEEYFKDYKYKPKPKYISPFQKMSKEEQEEMIASYRFVTSHVPLMDFYVDGEKVDLLKWGKQRIKIIKGSKEKITKDTNLDNFLITTLKDSDLGRVSYKGVYNGKTIIEKPKRGQFVIYN
tara:strand:+ start:685 stop:1476 length:792 start_codon:yes stop_codon:yes gene_type:complete